ncbi:uncharacterized protein LOC108215228 isoform X1 [Daucus carota subsp. sativus]|uniref:uncharacterized protein LOC108215228 isoform X1 n=2 Tax=Daucus carota subsp. sativus TaxID=79200 RepID=UPI0007F02D86|nr:PREDICTED: uncharacterized protein LOC108215228 isoform X1 [Daucus carota subsp. sativus]XP_017243118.1 PREDICTED: uncharacterized protein LOC108215228 isoform X1 [Daucus carota subsp. sativus]XP_017243119.1 PREDICTED: uncharacterized protein LOC108215228 isoform X1 [Daucus carota subsp. sativus]XP_017243120.1 PREDICTED: uncharacterized protein LOC108215228 isoform X1 [Daucus carota subsp. sativus]XP_017243121.1 PREDICTED: uncharacterized protein LOC108215228 isoform X1 [Daucus carota subsp.
MAALRFQAASLVASPCYPNAVAWSEENLVAVACGHVVTILTPNMPFGPRGLITVPPSQPFQIGVIDKEDLLSGCMQPISFHRDTSPCVRSISWSPTGLAPNSGCLLAVCTTEGRVKLYRFPFYDFSAEWVEILDISEKLYKYLLDVNFWESDVYSELFNERASELGKDHDVDTSTPVMRKNPKRKRRNDIAVSDSANDITEVSSFPCSLAIEGSSIEALKAPDDKLKSRSLQIVCMPKSKTKSKKRVPETHNVALISADKYASRSSMLASVVVSWSPLLQTSEYRLSSPDDSCDCCSILAIGGKSGMISFWKINKPQHYSIINNTYTNDVQLVGILHAHMSWVTTMNWAVSVSDASNHQLLLATGSSDGSVKIWHCYSAELLKPSKTSSASFSLFHELISVDSVPVSTLSLTVPIASAEKILLAVGKGSGALEVWKCDISTRKFHKVGSDDLHGHVVTGIAWAFDGNCLYSCNQDDSFHCWTLNGDSLCKVTLPSNTPGVESSTDVPNAFDSCFGLALSPGNLVVAVARRFDAGLLDPMYQLRSQKAAVEFFWTGGQQLDKLLKKCSDFDGEAFSGFSTRELINWDFNIMCSLSQHEHLNKPVVIWDVVAALLAFKQFAPIYVDHILAKWLRSYVGSNLENAPLQKVVSKYLSNITTRRLHFLNIIIRRVILADMKADKVNEENQSFVAEPGKGQMGLWLKLLKSSEKELRERLIYCSFSIVINLVSQSSENVSKLGYWQPAGLAQMENWVNSQQAHIRNSLKVLKSEFKKIKKSKLCSVGKYTAKEQCSYCSAPVPFESAEASFCQGTECENGVVQKHKLTRCAASMIVNDITPTWFCVCCNRRSSKFAPRALFSMLQYPSDLSKDPKITTLRPSSTPMCVFCGILLQRLQPEFLLAASPV